MKVSDFSTSKVVDKDGFRYVAIAEHCTDLNPNWAPEGAEAFALNKLIRKHFANNELCECQEGIFESVLSAEDLEKKLRVSGFIYNPVLDEIATDFLEE